MSIPKAKAIVVDIDGTLANDHWRRHLYTQPGRDWDAINAMSAQDTPNPWCQALVETFSDRGYHIIFLTARNETARAVTEAWLNANVVTTYQLFMRPAKDFRPDYIIKEGIYFSEIEPNFDVEFTVEDKQTVVDMWRRNGVVCLQCEPHND